MRCRWKCQGSEGGQAAAERNVHRAERPVYAGLFLCRKRLICIVIFLISYQNDKKIIYRLT